VKVVGWIALVWASLAALAPFADGLWLAHAGQAALFGAYGFTLIRRHRRAVPFTWLMVALVGTGTLLNGGPAELVIWLAFVVFAIAIQTGGQHRGIRRPAAPATLAGDVRDLLSFFGAPFEKPLRWIRRELAPALAAPRGFLLWIRRHSVQVLAVVGVLMFVYGASDWSTSRGSRVRARRTRSVAAAHYYDTHARIVMAIGAAGVVLAGFAARRRK
jgi:hypothetical protein